MRLRSTLAVAAAAGLSVLAVASPALAEGHHHARGTFSYSWTDHRGERHSAELVDPQARVCIDLPQVTGHRESLPPADSPRNGTDATAVVFSDAECGADHFSLRPVTGHASQRLKVRSVLFS